METTHKSHYGAVAPGPCSDGYANCAGPADESHAMHHSADYGLEENAPPERESDCTCDEHRIELIDKRLQEIEGTLEFIKATIVKADSTIATVAEQVMPTLNSLMESPMLKMLGVRKDKK